MPRKQNILRYLHFENFFEQENVTFQIQLYFKPAIICLVNSERELSIQLSQFLDNVNKLDQAYFT